MIRDNARMMTDELESMQGHFSRCVLALYTHTLQLLLQVLVYFLVSLMSKSQLGWRSLDPSRQTTYRDQQATAYRGN